MTKLSTVSLSPAIFTLAALVLLGDPGLSFADPSLRVIAGSADNCVASPRPGHREAIPLEIAMALGSSIIRNSVSAIGNYLTKAAQSTSSPLLTAIGYTDLFRTGSGSGGNLKIESNLECLVIVSGNFGELGAAGFSADYAKAADPDQIFVKVANEQADTSRLRDLGLIDLPTSYFEFKFDRHPLSEAFRLVPTLAYFRVSNAARNQQGPKNIEITVTISKPSPTGAADIQKVTGDSGLVAQIPIVLNQVIPGRIRKLGGLDFQSVWITSPKIPSEADVASAKQHLQEGVVNTFAPANVFVTYRETDQPDLMLSILASIVTDSSSEVSSGLEGALRSLLSGPKQSEH